MEETKLRQLFKNSADAYLDTIDDSVEQGMSEDCFIKAINQAFSLHGVVSSSCDCKKHSIKTSYGFEICTNCGNEWDV